MSKCNGEGSSDRGSKIAPDLRAFYESHRVEDIESILTTPAPVRFIRLNPRFDPNTTLQLLREELCAGQVPQTIPWLDDCFGFYSVPGDFNLSSSPTFRSGRIYGMDVSSGAAVAALLTSLYDTIGTHKSQDRQQGGDEKQQQQQHHLEKTVRVLDLCCAPGLKLCMLSDLIRSEHSTIVGVDISSSRLSLCKNIVKKYHVDSETSGEQNSTHTSSNSSNSSIRLYCADGVTFGQKRPDDDDEDAASLIFDSQVSKEQQAVAGKRKRMNKSARAREKKRLKVLQSQDFGDTNNAGIELFDRVLVDAECSTDGSFKHVRQQLKKQQNVADNQQLTNKEQLDGLVGLQKRLIDSGFRLLKSGGVMVYSTCSLSHDQNEGVVQWLLDKHSEKASIVPLDFNRHSKEKLSFILKGSIAGTVRFQPRGRGDEESFFGGGFFLAKIGKS